MKRKLNAKTSGEAGGATVKATVSREPAGQMLKSEAMPVGTWQSSHDDMPADCRGPYTVFPDPHEEDGICAYAFTDFLESLEEETFPKAMSKLASFYHLIKHNPMFRPEIEAMRMLLQGEHVLHEFIHKMDY